MEQIPNTNPSTSSLGNYSPDSLRAIWAVADHTLLKPDALRRDIELLCTEVLESKSIIGNYPKAVCVMPCFVNDCVRIIGSNPIAVCSVVGFPTGQTLAKPEEAIACVDAGATEIDMVLNYQLLKSGDAEFVQREVEAVAAACHARGALLKVIIETARLGDAKLKQEAALICVKAKADFVKTSTGFAEYGARVEDIELLRATVPATMGIKASGGIATWQEAKRMIDAGATRIGASGKLLASIRAALD